MFIVESPADRVRELCRDAGAVGMELLEAGLG